MNVPHSISQLVYSVELCIAAYKKLLAIANTLKTGNIKGKILGQLNRLRGLLSRLTKLGLATLCAVNVGAALGLVSSLIMVEKTMIVQPWPADFYSLNF